MSTPDREPPAEIAPAPPPPAPFLAPPPASGSPTRDLVVPPPDPYVPPAPPPAPTTSRYVDASSDRVVLFPTAETHPSGTIFISGYEILVGSIGYAVTDHFELEGSYAAGNIVDGALKLNLYRGTWLRFATVGAIDLFFSDLAQAPVYRLSGIGTACLSPDCWSSITLGAMGLASRSDLLPQRYGALFDAGAILAVTRLFKVLFEPVVEWEPGYLRPELAWSGGVRFSGEHWGLDLGVIPGVISGPEGEPVEYLPWVSFTVRTRVVE